MPLAENRTSHQLCSSLVLGQAPRSKQKKGCLKLGPYSTELLHSLPTRNGAFNRVKPRKPSPPPVWLSTDICIATHSCKHCMRTIMSGANEQCLEDSEVYLVQQKPGDLSLVHPFPPAQFPCRAATVLMPGRRSLRIPDIWLLSEPRAAGNQRHH